MTRIIEPFGRLEDDQEPDRRRHLLDAAHDAWMEALRDSWPIDREMLSRYAQTGSVMMQDGKALGFVLYERSRERGAIQAVVVHPRFRRQGIATALVRDALRELQKTGRGGISPPPPAIIELGGGYHYLWPGIPDDLVESRRFFDTVLGWPFTEPSYDMVLRLEDFSPSAEFYRRPGSVGITFRAGEPADMEEIHAFEERHFSMWTRYYRSHAPADIVVGIDRGSRIVAALILDMPPIVWAGVFGSSAAEIGAVGVDPAHHNLGIGTGLVATACETLRRRGADVAVLRWLYRVNFYSRLGFRVCKQYAMSSMELQGQTLCLPVVS